MIGVCDGEMVSKKENEMLFVWQTGRMVEIYFNVSLLNQLKKNWEKKIHKKSRDYKNLQMAKWIDERTIKRTFYTGKNKNGFLSNNTGKLENLLENIILQAYLNRKWNCVCVWMQNAS